MGESGARCALAGGLAARFGNGGRVLSRLVSSNTLNMNELKGLDPGWVGLVSGGSHLANRFHCNGRKPP